MREGLHMLKITHPAVTREAVWNAFRRSHDVRLRERYHAVLWLLDGQTCPDIAQWLSRDEETIRLWIHAVNDQGLDGLPRAPIPGRPP
jgi:transposase